MVILDFILYLQHVMLSFPSGSLADSYDAPYRPGIPTAGVRFHPLEIILSTGIKMPCVDLFGVPAQEVYYTRPCSTNRPAPSHGTICLSLLKMDYWLRFFIVTPDMQSPGSTTSVIIKEKKIQLLRPICLFWDRLSGPIGINPTRGTT